MPRQRRMCEWCKVNGRTYRSGLCFRCNEIPEAKERHPDPLKGKRMQGRTRAEPEQTMEELDLIEMEQRQNLPSWWQKECEK